MYVLTKLHDGEERFFTGEYIKSGPQMSSKIDKAKRFTTARSAYAFAGMSPHFRYFRAAPLDFKENEDGFKSRWWVR